MLIKFMGGQGGGGAIAAYLIDPNRPGREGAPPELVRGDLEQTRELIDGIDRKWAYTTGVISFAPEDRPTEAQQEALMDDFERTAFAGLEADQYDITWVRHSHTSEGRVELHFLTPRMELRSGRALNIAPPGHEGLYGALRDVWNHAEGWARPDDPERARTLQRPLERADRGQEREAIAAWVEERIAEGAINDRAELVEALKEAGLEVPRAGKDYITAFDPKSGERWRLKGRVYEQHWRREAELDRAAAGEGGRGSAGRGGGNPRRAEEARRELEARVRKRAERHARLYGGAPERGADSPWGDDGRDGSDRAPDALVARLDGAELPLRGAGLHGAALGHDGLEMARAAGPDGRDGEAAGGAGASGVEDGGREAGDKGAGAVSGSARGGGDVDVRGDALREASKPEAVTQGVGAWGEDRRDGPTDTAGARAFARLRELGAGVRRIGQAVERYGRALAGHLRAFVERDREREEEAGRAGAAFAGVDAELVRADAAHRELERLAEDFGERAQAMKAQRDRERQRQKIRGHDNDRGYGD